MLIDLNGFPLAPADPPPPCPMCAGTRVTGIAKGDEPMTWHCPDCAVTWTTEHHES